ncbi:predicted protein [Streptomyces viridochromogenes DSM 40736]|uniref:Predicted protein n=1 Tax=Streptomyces viridochromogenes (strain DSM 40736 / JCM 4977 / BCRC 1201 / Tue 494) TaxID=591159 RepID=D9XF88_STRVT|nr:predicted protein [Streptomyces viridochromogenes DSM 40736]
MGRRHGGDETRWDERRDDHPDAAPGPPGQARRGARGGAGARAVPTRLILSAPHGTESGERAKRDMGACFSELIGLRRDGTGEDVTSLLAAAVGRGGMTPAEAVGLAVPLQTGGETVMGTSGRLFHVLLTHPELAERLRAEPEIRPRAVHALLRRPGTADRLGGTPARLEAELLVDALLDGVPGLRLAVPAGEVPLGKGPLSRVPETLPVTW